MHDNSHPDTPVRPTWGVGRVVVGRYRLRATLGAGAMGVVWRADDLRLNREVALKQLRLPPGLPADEAARARQRVFREGRAAAKLQHANAVAVYDVIDDDQGQPVLALEYLPSESLADALAAYGPLPPERVARIGAAVASALAAAHDAGIVHRDVKPANILLGRNGHAKITDFGLSRVGGDVTGDGLVSGTPAFLSPEAAWGDPPGPESDVFSLGATLYAAVEGTPPFGTADNPIAQLERVAEGHAPPPRRAGPLTRVLTGMLHDDPAARPTMAEVAATLADLDSADETRPVAATHEDLEPVRRRRWALAAVALLAIGLGTLLAIMPLTGEDSAKRGAAAPPSTELPVSAAPPATQSSAVPTTTTPPSAPAVVPPTDPAVLERVVTRYFTLLPDDTAGAWALLGPAMQAKGRAGYDQFWAKVKDLRIDEAPRATGDSVVVEIEYNQEGRGRVRETHRLDLLVTGGTALINADQVVATDTPGGGPGTKKPGGN